MANALQRLGTDVIDLYQLHWPNRGSYHFRQYWDFDPSGQDRDATEAGRALRTAVRAHIKAIAERYIIEGETADGALMFLPSEAVYAELHANYGELVREGFAARVDRLFELAAYATAEVARREGLVLVYDAT